MKSSMTFSTRNGSSGSVANQSGSPTISVPYP